MIAVLSPAKTLDFDTALPNHTWTEPQFVEEAAYLIGKLRKYSAKQLGNLMRINPELAALNTARFASWQEDHRHGTRPAAFAFNGEVYRGLNVQEWSAEDLDFAQHHLRVLSGLYGLLRPLDAMHPYRLEMGTPLKVTAKKTNLYKFWDDRLRSTVEQALAGQPLINLASAEYFKALQPKALEVPVITCHFRELRGTEYKPLMTYAKHARGLMARFIVQERLTNPEDLKAFDRNNYTFAPALSTEADWVFTRDIPTNPAS